MSDESTVRGALSVFGLPERAVDAYLVVLQRDEVTVPAVREAIGEGEPPVRTLVDELADRSLLAVDETADPPIVRARRPEAAIEEVSSRLAAVRDAVDGLDAAGAPDAGSGDEPLDAGVDGSRSLPRLEVLHAAGTAIDRARRCLESADDEILAILPGAIFDELSPTLAAAKDRGVATYCMLSAPDVARLYGALDDPGRYADVVRTWDARHPLVVVGDDEEGIVASHDTFQEDGSDGYGVAFAEPELASGTYGHYVSTAWTMGEQRFVVEPPTLPATYEFFRAGVVAASLHATAGRDLVADLEIRDIQADETLSPSGVPIHEARQHLAEPALGSFPTEVALVVELDDGLATVAADTTGIGPFYEEYAGSRLTLHEA